MKNRSKRLLLLAVCLVCALALCSCHSIGNPWPASSTGTGTVDTAGTTDTATTTDATEQAAPESTPVILQEEIPDPSETDAPGVNG